MAIEIIRRRDALAQGRTQYFTNKICKNGHVAARWSHCGKCIECGLESTRKWRAENPEKNKSSRLASCRKFYAKNPEIVLASNKRWRDANLEKCRADSRRYAAANADKARDKANKWYAENTDRAKASVKEWQKGNRHKVRVYAKKYRNENPNKIRDSKERWRSENLGRWRLYNHLRRARKLKAGGAYTHEQVLGLFKKQKGKCASCLCSIKGGWHNDHIIALSRGGSNYISNIQLLCAPCNLEKSNKDPIEWAQQRGRLL